MKTPTAHLKMHDCPTCNGMGTYTTQIETISLKGEQGSGNGKPFKMTCHVCHGKGKLTLAQVRQLKREQNMWCSCGNPSGQTQFFDDGAHPHCDKHCHACMDCGKIVQVG